jgi:predicted small lipoprotein YifL
MKKVLCLLMALVILTGCGSKMGNTPTKKVEAFLNKYQTSDKDVMDDLDNTLNNDTTLTDSERTDYRNFMKKHYQDLTYKIKNEKIDGNIATVETEITVRNYADAVNKANEYRSNNPDKFNSTNTFATYRLNQLKKVTKTATYTINFYLAKSNDEWTVNDLSDQDESKINGLYGVNDANTVS